MDFQYIGWIPCVSGKLFFDFSECGISKNNQHPLIEVNHFEYKPNEDVLTRTIIISSEVKWKDYGGEKEFGDYQVFILSQSQITDENIGGKIYIINSKQYKNIKSKVTQLTYSINSSLIGQNSDEEINISEQYEQILDILSTSGLKQSYSVCFLIDSYGFAKFTELDCEVVSDELSNTSIIRQAYYYLKFAFHKHKHHDESAESLTSIHKINFSDKDFGLVFINELKRSLVEMNRDFLPTKYKLLSQSQGIVTYSKSLLRSCLAKSYIDVDTYNCQLSYLENIDRSLSISSEKIEKDVSHKSMVSGNARAIILFIFAFITPLLLVFKDKIVLQKDSFVFTIIQSLFKSDVTIISAIILAISLYVFYIFINLRFGSTSLAISFVKRVLKYLVNEAHRYSESYKTRIFLYLVIPGLIILGFVTGVNLIFDLKLMSLLHSFFS